MDHRGAEGAGRWIAEGEELGGDGLLRLNRIRHVRHGRPLKAAISISAVTSIALTPFQQPSGIPLYHPPNLPCLQPHRKMANMLKPFPAHKGVHEHDTGGGLQLGFRVEG